jgi:hypothetical protein
MLKRNISSRSQKPAGWQDQKWYRGPTAARGQTVDFGLFPFFLRNQEFLLIPEKILKPEKILEPEKILIPEFLLYVKLLGKIRNQNFF